MPLERTGTYRTCLERRMHEILTNLGIKHFEQVPIKSYVLDFVVPLPDGHELDIEVDGAPFHIATGKQRSRDAYRDYRLRRYGMAVERFGENFTTEDVVRRLEQYGLIKAETA